MINQDRMIFGDFAVNFEPIRLDYIEILHLGHFLLKTTGWKVRKIIINISKIRPFAMY